jgi:hypothetical protein
VVSETPFLPLWSPHGCSSSGSTVGTNSPWQSDNCWLIDHVTSVWSDGLEFVVDNGVDGLSIALDGRIFVSPAPHDQFTTVSNHTS